MLSTEESLRMVTSGFGAIATIGLFVPGSITLAFRLTAG